MPTELGLFRGTQCTGTECSEGLSVQSVPCSQVKDLSELAEDDEAAEAEAAAQVRSMHSRRSGRQERQRQQQKQLQRWVHSRWCIKCCAAGGVHAMAPQAGTATTASTKGDPMSSLSHVQYHAVGVQYHANGTPLRAHLAQQGRGLEGLL